jgi:hypothetical protein
MVDHWCLGIILANKINCNSSWPILNLLTYMVTNRIFCYRLSNYHLGLIFNYEIPIGVKLVNLAFEQPPHVLIR